MNNMNNINNIDSNKLNELCNIVMRQTNYTKDECIEKLKLYNYNIILVINEYMGIKKKSVQKKTTTNQMIYSEFRNFLDNASNTYRYKKEYMSKLAEKREKFLNNSNIILDNSNSNLVLDNSN